MRRQIRVLEATSPAVVLGSAQRDAIIDKDRAAQAGVEIVRRSSGGGAVLVGPGQSVWIDLVIPAGDRLWSSDVGQAMWWVGEAWRAALASEVSAGRLAALEPHAPSVWHGPMVRTTWSDRICFAGLGPGEVTVTDPSGRPAKVVGIAQRRTRHGSLFQCAAALRWAPAELLDLLVSSDEEREEAAAGLAPVAIGLGSSAAATVVDALVDQVTRQLP